MPGSRRLSVIAQVLVFFAATAVGIPIAVWSGIPLSAAWLVSVWVVTVGTMRAWDMYWARVAKRPGKKTFGELEPHWRQFASDTSAEFVPVPHGTFKVQTSYQPWMLTLDTHRFQIRHNAHSPILRERTRIRVPFVTTSGFRFEVYRHGYLDSIAIRLGVEDIVVGDAEFDRQFVVRANDGVMVRRLFDWRLTCV